MRPGGIKFGRRLKQNRAKADARKKLDASGEWETYRVRSKNKGRIKMRRRVRGAA